MKRSGRSVARIARIPLLGLSVCLSVWRVTGLIAVGSAVAATAESGSDRLLRFVPATGEPRLLSLGELLEGCETVEVEVDDPYHERRMRYLGLPLRCVLELGFADAGGAEALVGQGLLLRALDGYTRPVSGAGLLEPGGVLAFAEPEVGDSRSGSPRFSPIGRRQIDPGPFYLVWTGEDQNDPHESPWPYQLATIEVAPFEVAFPHTVPTGADPKDPAWVGYAIFQRSCAACHAINGEGGKVGPDLNVPKSIVEYRPLEQIRAYIRDPEAFRYTSMPAHSALREADLDALIAYFSAMRERKNDPRTRGTP